YSWMSSSVFTCEKPATGPIAWTGAGDGGAPVAPRWKLQAPNAASAVAVSVARLKGNDRSRMNVLSDYRPSPVLTSRAGTSPVRKRSRRGHSWPTAALAAPAKAPGAGGADDP